MLQQRFLHLIRARGGSCATRGARGRPSTLSANFVSFRQAGQRDEGSIFLHRILVIEGAAVIPVPERKERFCNGLKRREFLRLGALGLGGLTLADLLRCEAQGGNAGRPKSIIYVVLPGGPSHIDM